MKYSILFPYCRRESLKSSLISFVHHYSNRNDYEVILVEDLANSEEPENHNRLLNIIEEFKDKISIKYSLDDFRSYNSAKKYNIGYKNSTGQFLILSNPETFHEVNILNGLDEQFSKDPNCYVMCSCLAVNFPKQAIDTFEEYRSCTPTIWYQHSQHNNRMLHFCSALSRENYQKIGGFDEKYCKGIAYEDDSFRHRVLFNNIPIVLRDDLVTLHIEHSRQYLEDNRNLYRLNEELWRRQHATNDFFEKFV